MIAAGTTCAVSGALYAARQSHERVVGFGRGIAKDPAAVGGIATKIAGSTDDAGV
jgi:hypothetical protein